MEPEINDKDVLLIKESKVVDHNKVGIFRYNGDLFCKRLIREHGKAYLKSDNESAQEPIQISESDELAAIGLVVGKY